MITGENIQKEYGIRQVLDIEKLEIRDGDRIGLVGRNGIWKSTLLQILSGRLKPEKGVVKRNCGMACILQTGETEGEAEGRYISQKQLRDSAIQSGGERVKTALAKLLVSDVNFLILDEPTNHMDVYTMEGLERLSFGFVTYIY